MVWSGDRCGQFFNGEMCNIGIWSRGLTNTEIANLTSTYPSSGLIGQYLIPNGTITPASIDLSFVNTEVASWFAAYGIRTMTLL